MNILVLHSWLKTLLETDKSARFIAENLSLTGFTVEKVSRVGKETVFDIEITTNRPDAASLVGIAREIYANFKYNRIPVKLLEPEGIDFTPKLESRQLPLEVKIQKPKLCPRFSAVILDNVAIKPSPPKIQTHLELAGVRALNNLVDISNYLMLELGQPMHVFDYDKIRDSKIFLREAKSGEEIITLDGAKRKLSKGAIVIEDGGARLIDLCGIMGGANSGIGQNTKRVLLFVQTYDPVRIRKTTQNLGFRTESSVRFEKGLDPEGVIGALNRAVYLAKKLANVKVASKIIDIYDTPYKPKTVKVSKVKLDQYLGINVSLAKAAGILQSLGFDATYSKTEITAVVPSFRAADIEIGQDLIEEIARISGYDKIPAKLPSGEIKPTFDPLFYWGERAKDYLKYAGFTEIVTYSMIAKEDLGKIGVTPAKTLKIRNPLNSDLEYLRPTLLPSLLKVVAANQNKRENLRFFELAARYEPKGSLAPQEILSLAGVIQTDNFFEVKGVIEGLFYDLGVKVNFSQTIIPNLVAQQTAKITAGEQELGRIGKAEPTVVKSFGVKDPVFVFGFDFEKVASKAKLTKKYTPISKYPEVVEDISMVVDVKTEVGKILDVIHKAGENLLTKTKVFDIFTDAKLSQNKKSVAVHLTYQSHTHNLSSKEVETVRKRIISALESQILAEVRLKEP